MDNRQGAAAWTVYAWAAACAAAALIVYLPTLGNGFVRWDEFFLTREVAPNAGLGSAALAGLFLRLTADTYHPLSLSAGVLLHRVHGLDPQVFHAASLLLHAATTALVFLIGVRCCRSCPTGADGSAAPDTAMWPAVFGALLFGLHPLLVEAVAGAAYLSDLMAGFFAALAVVLYLRHAAAPEAGRPVTAWLAASWLAALCSGLSRWEGVHLPLVLLVLDAHPLRRLGGAGTRRALLEKVPYLAVSAAVLLANAAAKSGHAASTVSLPSGALPALLFYPFRWLLPIDLVPYYAFKGALNPLGMTPAASAAILAALTGALAAVRGRWPGLLAAWICYLAGIAPVLGMSPEGGLLLHDRYAYLSCLGFPLLAAEGLRRLVAARKAQPAASPLLDRLLPGAAALVLACAAWLTTQQTAVWQGPESLWRHVLSVDPRSAGANELLGAALLDEGRHAEAVHHFRAALEQDPAGSAKNLAAAYTNWGVALFGRRRFAEAASRFREALRWNPGLGEARENLSRAEAAARATEGGRRARRAAPRSPAWRPPRS